MSLWRGMLGLGKFVGWLVMGAFVVAACSGASEGDDEGDDDGNRGTSCATYCERLAACPEAAADYCLEGCASTEADADASGCSIEFDRALTCLGTDVCGQPTSTCEARLLELDDCTIFGGGGGCAPSGTAPANGNCVPICQRVNACAGAGQVDCATECATAEATAANAGCSVEYRAYVGCFGTCTNVCATTGNECSLELDAYSACVF